MKKWCSKCCRSKHVDEFGNRAASKDGKQHWCKRCIAGSVAKIRQDPMRRAAMVEKTKEWRKRNPGQRGQPRRRTTEENQRARRWLNVRRAVDPVVAARQKAKDDRNAKLYRERHPDKVLDRVHCRRAKQREVTVEPVSRRKVWERDGGICQLCGDPVPFKKMHLDHKVPLAKDGEHSYANTQTSCGPCNLKKGCKIQKTDLNRRHGCLADLMNSLS